MKILGIDPGIATTGFGVIDTKKEGVYTLIDYGLVSTTKELPHGERLSLIYTGISKLIETHSPDVVSIERLFFATNALTAITVGQAIGVIKLAIHDHHLQVYDYTPMQVKLVIGGSGKADKQMIKAAVRKIMKFRGSKVNETRDGHARGKVNSKSHFDDAADALALAVCHARKTLSQVLV